MPATYEKIQSTTLGSASATITFSSIPATYTDLRVVIVALQGSGNNIALRFNSDSGTNYSQTRLIGDGTTASSTRNTSDNEIDLNQQGLSSSIPSLYNVDLFSYAGSTFKTLLASINEDRNGSGSVLSVVGLYRSTSAITSILITSLSADTMGVGTTATLYGILKA